MINEIRYIELKTGYSDNGPAWISKVKLSKSGNTVYFYNKALKKRTGICGNYYDVETKEEYWISGVKKDGADRHWAGSGRIMLDQSIVNEYLTTVGKDTVDHCRFTIVEIPEVYPVERIHRLENKKQY